MNPFKLKKMHEFFVFCFPLMLGVEPKALHVLGK
jgi:hypothetical protein